MPVAWWTICAIDIAVRFGTFILTLNIIPFHWIYNTSNKYTICYRNNFSISQTLQKIHRVLWMQAHILSWWVKSFEVNTSFHKNDHGKKYSAEQVLHSRSNLPPLNNNLYISLIWRIISVIKLKGCNANTKRAR